MQLFLGTSGWDYPDWVGAFYPDKLPKAQWLPYVATRMRTVEIDSTFYGAPRETTVAKWIGQTPSGFAFSPKLPKAITHEAKLVDCRPLLEAFCAVMRQFGDRLGVICIQLPPWFRQSQRPTLERFLGWLPEDLPFGVEFRHPSWMEPAVHDLLAAYRVAWVNSDQQREVVLTAPFTYVRLLGERELISQFHAIQIDRSDELDRWAAMLARISNRVERVYAYVNNHFEGHSPATLERLRERLAAHGVVEETMPPASAGEESLYTPPP